MICSELQTMRISIHALRKESDRTGLVERTREQISIHALRKESDHLGIGRKSSHQGFQSTLSVRRATFLSTVFNIRNYISIHALRKESDSKPQLGGALPEISIHALRKESDVATCSWRTASIYFNPRSP